MRNLHLYPITLEEKIQVLEQTIETISAIFEEKQSVGDIDLCALDEILKDYQEEQEAESNLVDMEIDIDDDLFLAYAQEAHARNITLNDFIVGILTELVNSGDHLHHEDAADAGSESV